MASVLKRKRSDLEDHLINEVKYPDIRIYILPQRIQKTRMDILKKAACKKGFVVEESFSGSVTHVVSQYDSAEKILEALKRKSVENVELVNVNWLTACNTKGKPVTITESYRIKYSNPKEEYKPSDQQPSSNKDVKYICQRPAP
ncbi:DNA nucleotidylexotransferase-like, partial [Actinia tenebrosa]|uniref:DNA nucleotidylexotransferase-like n=1 Tax=Actinia tenebrosa TaxID=6105 RepID=A0A6P8GXV5_ACTTE